MGKRLPFNWLGYQTYSDQNPHVFPLLERFALERLTRAKGRFSMKAVVERARWETAVTTTDEDARKFNDRWTAFHTRRFLSVYPVFFGRLEIRRSEADTGWDHINLV